MGLDRNRTLLVISLGVLAASMALFIHFGRLYDANIMADSVAHFTSGIAVGGAIYLLLRQYSGLDGRTVDTLAILSVLVVGVGWEIAEATVVPYAGYYVHGAEDTVLDIVLVVLGGAIPVWLGRKYHR